jgi:hypothetical protein
VLTDHGAMVLLNTYVPFACSDDPPRWDFKTHFHHALRLRWVEAGGGWV